MAAAGPPDEPPRRPRARAFDFTEPRREAEPEPPRPTPEDLRLARSIIGSNVQPQEEELTDEEFASYKSVIEDSRRILAQERRWQDWQSRQGPSWPSRPGVFGIVPAQNVRFDLAPGGLDLAMAELRRMAERASARMEEERKKAGKKR